MHHMMHVLQQPWANMAAPSSFSKVAGVVERVATHRISIPRGAIRRPHPRMRAA
jgi:hypothetical protein